MSRHFKSFLFIGVVLLSTLLFIKDNDKKELRTLPAFSEEAPLTKETPPSSSPEKVKEEFTKLPSRIQDKIAQFPQNSGAEYEKSLAKDPHQTPEVVLQGALRLGEIYDLVKSEKEAQEAFDFFSTCVANENIIALQTACFRYARELSKNYPYLNESFLALEQKTSDTVLRIVRFE
jgi:hypothetical protein